MSSPKVILVTGSNTGIGYELVHLLAAKGHTVYLASRKLESGLDAVAKIKKEKNLDVKFVQLDVTDVSSIEAAVASIKKNEGRLDVLVNNAGVAEMHISQNALEPSLPAMRATMETNLFGLVQTTAAFLPLIRASSTSENPAAIVTVSSDMASNTLMASDKGYMYQVVAYNTSKAAANSYTIALAYELRAEGIKVNAVTPGFTTTKINGFTAGGGDTRARRKVYSTLVLA
ncbi:hypothetical protein MIND_01322500 [Mycena indigotica]|uniref:NAD(P)-binding protein n=1 Tax=Mycena indigotica TaxID=2126181 RepID=A0A8H6VWJ0_9AGAR|nr:uncharacterized protein MIND_01322500 [Mycena indigotica]KAF7290814.1 hypothetical protein MIND_01322500 [Mycena indigotica]